MRSYLLVLLAVVALFMLALAPRQVKVPSGAAPPYYCDVGELFLDTDETDDTNCTTTADNSLCACVAVNTWDTTE